MAQDPLAQLGVPAIPNVSATTSADPLASLGTPAVHADASSAPDSRIGPVSAGLGEAGGDIVGAVKAAPAGIWHAIESVATENPLLPGSGLVPDRIKHPIDTYHTDLQRSLPIIDAYEKKRAAGGSVTESLAAANEQAKSMGGITGRIAEKLDELKQNPTREGVRDLTDISAALAAMYGLGKAGEAILPEEGAVETAATPAAATAAPTAAAVTPAAEERIWSRLNPFRARQTAQEIVQGKGIAQPAAAGAVRSAVGAGEDVPILQGAKTVVDQPLIDLATREKAAYSAVDKAAGFDVKAEKLQLKNDEYNLKQLGNTDADKAARTKLQASIADSTQRIADAETKLSAAGIDPKAADALHTSRMAGNDFKNSLVRVTAPDGTISVDKLLNQSKALRFSKRGDRLAQFLGKTEADQYMTALEDAQKAGVAAVRTQQLAKWIGIKALQGAGLFTGGEIARKLLE